MDSNDRLPGMVAISSIVGCVFFPNFFSSLALGLPRAAAEPAFWWITAVALVLVTVALVFGPDLENSSATGWLAIIGVGFLAVALVETIPFAAYRLSLGMEIANGASVGAALGTILFFLSSIWRAPIGGWVVAGLIFSHVYITAAFVQSADVPPMYIYTVPFWTLMLIAIIAVARTVRK